MQDEDISSHKLSIFLLKEDIKDYRQSLKENVHVEHEYVFNQKIRFDGEVLLGLTKSYEPSWKEFIQEAVDERLPDLVNTSNRAIVFFKVERRIFALPFGYGKHLLKEEAIDRDFGLKTVLNLVNPDKLVSVDKASLNDLTLLTRTQSSIKSNPESFSIDVIKDLLRGVTGEALNYTSSKIGKVITGNEGISIIPTIKFEEIPDCIVELKKAFESTRYKERFDWIDNIKNERDPIIIKSLQELFLNDLKHRNSDKINLAPPFILEWESFEGLSFTPQGELEMDFDIETFFNLRKDYLLDLDWDKLQRLKIYIKYGDDDEMHGYNIWRFLNYQTELNGDLYVFTLSNWYRVSKTFAEEIIEFVSQIKESDIPFIDCEFGIDEREYNQRLAASKPFYRLLDRDLVRSDLSRSEIEVCDVISESMEFIHIKFRSSSATLSHLFAQGRISAYSLRRDKTFRKNLRTKFHNLGIKRDLVPIDSNQVDPNNYTITFAIIEKTKRSFIEALPFFSLLNFRLTAEDLLLLGYNVKVKKIQLKDYKLKRTKLPE